MASGLREFGAICVLIALVVSHYKLMQTIQLYYDCTILLIFSTGLFGMLPLLFVRMVFRFDVRNGDFREELRRVDSDAWGEAFNGSNSYQELGFESLSTIGVIRILGVPSKKLFMQAALIGLLNTLAFVTSIWAITKTALWISMSLCNVDCAFNLILSVLFLGENCSIAKVSGMSLTVVGGTLLAVSGAMTRNSNKASNSLEGDIASIIYALELSVLMVAWKKFLSKFTWSLLFTINGLAGVFEVLIILPILIWAYSTGFEGKGWDSPATVVAMCLLNGLVHLALSLWWSFCIGYTSPTYVSVAGVMIIPVTTLADYFQFRFKLQWMDALATVIILAGFLVTRHGYAQSSNDSTSPDEAAEIHDKPNERDSDRSLLEGASLRDDARHSLLSVDDRKAKMGASEALLGS